jgi:hypothetical protein
MISDSIYNLFTDDGIVKNINEIINNNEHYSNSSHY